jgi:hypothetical protein
LCQRDDAADHKRSAKNVLTDSTPRELSHYDLASGYYAEDARCQNTPHRKAEVRLRYDAASLGVSLRAFRDQYLSQNVGHQLSSDAASYPERTDNMATSLQKDPKIPNGHLDSGYSSFSSVRPGKCWSSALKWVISSVRPGKFRSNALNRVPSPVFQAKFWNITINWVTCSSFKPNFVTFP